MTNPVEKAQAAIAAMDAADKAFKAIDASINSTEYYEAWRELDLSADAAMSRSVAAIRSLRVVGWQWRDKRGVLLNTFDDRERAMRRCDTSIGDRVFPVYAEDQP